MTICLAYAPTEPGRAALRHCVAEARAMGCDVIVVNAARDWHDTPAELDEEAVREVERQLDGAGIDWRWRQGEHGLRGADEILTAIEEADVTMVVIGVTDRSHVQKRIVSDTTKQVLLDAACAVLAVRAEHEAPTTLA
ncbi:universal stress protein [Arsenicicoccus cauae]|uniref:universal stress protein n=1 Tax=Arsenicicoccus cauae TaxID=2663847 RepID=UPI00370DCEF5